MSDVYEHEFGPNTEKIEEATKLLLEAIGEDLSRPGLVETPHRVAKMWKEFFEMREYGFKEFAEMDTLNNGFVMLKNIPVNSLCEHHLVPFIGHAAIAYFPKLNEDGTKQIIGISKLARIVYKHSYKPQVQERLTLGVLNEIKELVGTDDVIVYVDAKHLCMSMRGARASDSTTITMDYDGVFKDDPGIRREFLMLVN